MLHSWDNSKIPILQLGADFFDAAVPASFPLEKLRFWNENVACHIEKRRLWNFSPLENNLQIPLALRYHGHQFQNYNPQLGDGRGFLFAQVQLERQWYDLGTKGSGQTKYSRSGDGRLTLKGAMREALATEMLESLGVTTSKTFCFFETGENLVRSDEPSPTRSAVLTRFSLGHIRIGTFQRLAFLQQPENIKKLVSYCLFFYYQNHFTDAVAKDDTVMASRFLELVVERNAKLCAEVMLAGFVHGVLNTDNINISGELFDYGPYRFLPNYDPAFTAAYFDQQGLYAYGRQPTVFLWNLHQLAKSLEIAFPDLMSEEILNTFNESFNASLRKSFQKRLNLKANCSDELQGEAISLFFQLMEQKKLDFEKTFFDFNSFSSARLEKSEQATLYKGNIFDNLKDILNLFEIADGKVKTNNYFSSLQPETLLIDEIETIWSAIDLNDDWNLFNAKINSIRRLRGLY